MSRTRCRVDSLLQDSAHPDRSSSIRSELWCLPMSAILVRKPTTSRWTSGEPTSRALPAAHHSSFFPRHSFSLSPSTPCPLVMYLFFSYSVSHSRARRLTYLAADRTGVHVRFLANVPRRTLTLVISNEIKVHFTKLTAFRCPMRFIFEFLFLISNEIYLAILL